MIRALPAVNWCNGKWLRTLTSKLMILLRLSERTSATNCHEAQHQHRDFARMGGRNPLGGPARGRIGIWDVLRAGTGTGVDAARRLLGSSRRLRRETLADSLPNYTIVLAALSICPSATRATAAAPRFPLRSAASRSRRIFSAGSVA